MLLENAPIPLEFRRIQAANLVGWSGTLPSAGFDELVAAVSDVLSGSAPAAVQPATESRSNEGGGATSVKAETAVSRGAGLLNTRVNRWVTLAVAAVVLIGIAIYVKAHIEPAGKTPASRQNTDQVRENSKDGLTYVWIPPGRFMMGCSPGDDQCNSDEKPSHPVSISKGFWMGQTEVTQEAYQRVLGQNPSASKERCGPWRP